MAHSNLVARRVSVSLLGFTILVIPHQPPDRMRRDLSPLPPTPDDSYPKSKDRADVRAQDISSVDPLRFPALRLSTSSGLHTYHSYAYLPLLVLSLIALAPA